MVARCFADPHEYLDGGALAFALASGIVIWLLFGPGAISAPAELAAPSGAAVADGALHTLATSLLRLAPLSLLPALLPRPAPLSLLPALLSLLALANLP